MTLLSKNIINLSKNSSKFSAANNGIVVVEFTKKLAIELQKALKFVSFTNNSPRPQKLIEVINIANDDIRIESLEDMIKVADIILSIMVVGNGHTIENEFTIEKKVIKNKSLRILHINELAIQNIFVMS